MFPDNNIQDELKSISTVLKSGINGNLYSVPEDYFEINTINLLSNSISSIKMEVPDAFFDHFPENILSKIKSEHIPYNFEIISNSKPQVKFGVNLKPSSSKIKPARVVSFKPFYKYAIAAVFTGLIGLGIFTNLFKQNSNNLLKSEVYASASKIIENNNFDEILSSISADEATDYLTSYGQDVNSALVALSAENYKLETPEELFISENELDLFLKEYNIQSIN